MGIGEIIVSGGCYYEIGRTTLNNSPPASRRHSHGVARLTIRSAQLTMRNAQLTMRNAQLTMRNAQLTMRNAQLMMRNAQLMMRNAQLMMRNAQLMMRNAQLMMRNAQLTMCNAQLTMCNAQLTMCNAQLTMHNAQLTMHNAQLTMHNAQLTMHNAWFTMHNAWFTMRFAKIMKCCYQDAERRMVPLLSYLNSTIFNVISVCSYRLTTACISGGQRGEWLITAVLVNAKYPVHSALLFNNTVLTLTGDTETFHSHVYIS